MIPALSLWQPWASLIALGVKTIETRSWSTQYRGPLAIHAGAKKPRNVWAQEPPDLYDPIAIDRYLEITEDVHGSGSFLYQWRGPLGAIVATCTLADVVPLVGLGEETAVRRIEVGTAVGEPNLMLCAPDPAVTEYPPEVSFRFNDEPEAGIDFDASDYYERDVTDQRPYGDFTPGRFAWLLADIVPVDPPVPFKGGQGLSRKWAPEGAAA